MNRFKIIAMILIIGAGLVGASFITKNSVPVIGSKDDKNEQAAKNENLTEMTPVQWLEKTGLANNTSSNKNMTDSLGETFVNVLKEESGGNAQNLNIPNMDEASRKIVEESIKSAQIELSRTINDSDIKISGDNSIAAKKNYLNAIREISQKNFSGFSKSGNDVLSDITKGELSSAEKLASIYSNILEDYFKVLVPSDWADVHKKLILYFYKQRFIYSSLVNYNDDPIKAYLAAQTIDQVVTEGNNLQELVAKKSKEAGL